VRTVKRGDGSGPSAVRRPTVAGVGAIAAFAGMLEVAEVRRHLGFQSSLYTALRQLGQQALFTEYLSWLLTLQQAVRSS
jgi:hypothetical protein